MPPDQLAALEHAAEPYINAGYRVFSQTDTSLTLIRARPRLSITVLIVLLIVFWPAAIIYSVALSGQTHIRGTSRCKSNDIGNTKAIRPK